MKLIKAGTESDLTVTSQTFRMPDINVYLYNDVKPFTKATSKVHCNLCTWYYEDKKRFCGNYCSRSAKHGFEFHRRCWRHKRNLYSSQIPPLVLLMISSSPRIYNRHRWITFLVKCQRQAVPVELVIYHENMLKGTVRDPMNLVSRFRPFPNLFGKVLIIGQPTRWYRIHTGLPTDVGVCL